MVEVYARDDMTIEPPKNITVENVQFWCKHGKALKQTQRHKAMQFVEYGCIRYVGDDPEFTSKHTFVCLPLNPMENWEITGENNTLRSFNKIPFPAHYNNSDYKIYKNNDNVFECNCQGWQTKAKKGEMQDDGVQCSHILALFYCFKMKRFGKQHGASEKQVTPDPLEEQQEELGDEEE